MVIPVAINVARLVARAAPKAFAVIDATCTALEKDGGGTRAIEALRQSCDVRKITKRKRRK